MEIIKKKSKREQDSQPEKAIFTIVAANMFEISANMIVEIKQTSNTQWACLKAF